MQAFPSDVDLPKVEIHVTEVCNNRCGFCTTGWINAEDGPELVHVPREVIRAQLEGAYAQGARRALFQGGEPTVRRDLGDLLADAHAIGYEATTIFTNARMGASRAGARWLASMGVTWFQVSIQGGTAEAHDASVGARGAFEQTLAGTRRLLQAGQRVKINGVLTRHLLGSIDTFAARMIDLRPEEVGLDTVKPSHAFLPGRASYADLVPPLGPHAAALRDAVLAMHRAGIMVRLTSFPPCLVPGAEPFVSEEAGATLTQRSEGDPVRKLLWKRAMQVKAPCCAACAYDAVCGGVYTSYAEANGLDELHPLPARAGPPPTEASAAFETDLTRALRSYLVRPSRGPYKVSAVRGLADGSQEIDCASPGGGLCISVTRVDDGAAARAPSFYARAGRFGIGYRREPGRPDPDLRMVDAVVQALRRIEARLPA